MISAGVMELADVTDSKSVGSDTVWVRVPPPAPKIDRSIPVDFLSIAKAMAYHHALACISSITALPLLYFITPSGVYQKAFAMMIYRTSF